MRSGLLGVKVGEVRKAVDQGGRGGGAGVGASNRAQKGNGLGHEGEFGVLDIGRGGGK